MADRPNSPVGRRFELVQRSTSSQTTAANDPCVFKVGSTWYMLHSGPGVPGSIHDGLSQVGPWNVGTTLVISGGVGAVEKPTLLLNLDGEPAVIDGLYHLFYVANVGYKRIAHATASSIGANWTYQGVSVERGAASDIDGQHADVVCATCDDDGTINIVYSANPQQSLSDFGYSQRIARATSSSVNGPFTKLGAIITPSTTSGDWDYGGNQPGNIRRLKDGSLVMGMLCSDTRPSSAGAEPDTHRVGFATAPTMAGPWTKSPLNPVVTTQAGTVAINNIWRPFLTYDQDRSRWILHINAGPYGSAERIFPWVDTSFGPVTYEPPVNWSAVFDDNFDRADSSTVGNGWNNQAGFSIAGKTLVRAAGGMSALLQMSQTGVADTSNTRATLYIKAFAQHVAYCVAGRMVDANNGLFICAKYFNSIPLLVLVRRVGGVETTLMQFGASDGLAYTLGADYRLSFLTRSFTTAGTVAGTLIVGELYDVTNRKWITRDWGLYDFTAAFQNVTRPMGLYIYQDFANSFKASRFTIERADKTIAESLVPVASTDAVKLSSGKVHGGAAATLSSGKTFGS